MELRADSGEKDKRKPLGASQKADAGWFVFWYVFCFAMFRFDLLPKHHPWFQHPTPTAKAGWIALFYALMAWLFTKLRFAAR